MSQTEAQAQEDESCLRDSQDLLLESVFDTCHDLRHDLHRQGRQPGWPALCVRGLLRGREGARSSLSRSARAGSSWGHGLREGEGRARAGTSERRATVGLRSGTCWPPPAGLSGGKLSPCGWFQGMKVFFLVVAAVYVLYLLFLVVRACSELRHMPYVGERHCTSARARWPGRSGWRPQASGLEAGDPETGHPPAGWVTGPCGRSLGAQGRPVDGR